MASRFCFLLTPADVNSIGARDMAHPEPGRDEWSDYMERDRASHWISSSFAMSQLCNWGQEAQLTDLFCSSALGRG